MAPGNVYILVYVQQGAQAHLGDVGEDNPMMTMLNSSAASSMAWQQSARPGNKKYSGSAQGLDVPPAVKGATDPLASGAQAHLGDVGEGNPMMAMLSSSAARIDDRHRRCDWG